MSKWMATLLCACLLTGFCATAASEPFLETRTETRLTWGDLPLLDAETNAALKSLAKVLRFETRAYQGDGLGYVATDVFLKDVSVLDCALQSQDGMYFEQSSLLGGLTYALSKDDFAVFAKRLSQRSGGAMPENLDLLFDVVQTAIGGSTGVPMDADTLTEAMDRIDAWKIGAMTRSLRRQPMVTLPGLYGSRAEVIELTRAEAISLAQALSSVLLKSPETVQGATLAGVATGDEATVRAVTAKVTDALYTLPETVADALPLTLAPTEYREIFSSAGALVVRQLDCTLPGDLHVFAEWQTSDTGDLLSFNIEVKVRESVLSLMRTLETGSPVTTGKAQKQENRSILQFTLSDPALSFDATVTRFTTIETQNGRRTTTEKFDCMMESPQAFGEGALVTLAALSKAVDSGEAVQRAIVQTTDFYIKGLGFDGKKVLTCESTTSFALPSMPIDTMKNVVNLAAISEADFDLWLADTQVSVVQAGYTVLGRLPKDVAAYVLDRFFQEP